MLATIIELTNGPIDYADLTERVRSNQAGAVVLFLGTVREMTSGRQTSSLDYEGYPEMAEKMMAEIDREAREKWPIVNSGIVHRLGHLELGEISVAAACLLEHHREVVASSGVSEVTGVLEIDASVGRQAFFVEQSTFVASGGFFE